jgi:hypothetical protein
MFFGQPRSRPAAPNDLHAGGLPLVYLSFRHQYSRNPSLEQLRGNACDQLVNDFRLDELRSS